MLLNAGVEERTRLSAKSPNGSGLPLGFFLLLEIAHWLCHARSGRRDRQRRGRVRSRQRPRTIFPMALFQQYLFPFEATSILILIAILGALVLARKDE